MLNVLFVLLSVHIALVLVVLLSYVPIALQSRNGFVQVMKNLGLIAFVPYVPAFIICVVWIDKFDEWRRK